MKFVKYRLIILQYCKKRKQKVNNIVFIYLQFYLILNVAIGGTNGFFPDNWSYNTPKPWKNTSPTEPADFWNKRSSWLPTWHGDDVAMIVDYVKMEQY